MHASKRKRLLVVILVLALAFPSFAPNASGQEMAQEPPMETSEPSAGENLGYGFGSVLASIFYSPAKVTYAGLGLITGGLGFILSAGNMDVATNIINPAVRGDYVVTPRHLRGEESLIFVGPTVSPAPEARLEQAPAAPPPY